ncbi:MAG: sorbitol-specific phosphotransferase system component IIA, partial [Pseudohongiellaceae bacterium]
MNITSETYQLLQLFHILGTGRAASAQEMRLIEISVDEVGGLAKTYAIIDSFMQDQVSRNGYADVIRATAKYCAGLELSDAEVTEVMDWLPVAKGESSWSETFIDLAADKGILGVTIVGRAEIAVHFTELLDSSGKSCLSVDFDTGATVTGASAQLKEAYSALARTVFETKTQGAISNLGNETLVATDSGSVAATALIELDALTTGIVVFTSVSDVSGTTEEIIAAYAGNTAGTIKGLENKALTVTGPGSVLATALTELGALTSGAVDISSATNVSGTTAEIIAAYAGNTAATIKGLENKALAVTDSGSVAATALTELGALTSGAIDVSSATNVSGTTAEIIAAYAGNTAATIMGLENKALTVTDSGSVAATALTELGALTSGAVDISSATNVSGTTAEIIAAYAGNTAATI